MSIAKGGKGKNVPYATTHYRIPEPLKPLVVLLAERYREMVFNGDDIEVAAEKLAEYWVDKPGTKNTKLTQREMKRLKSAVAIINEGLTLKANAGGAIKTKVKEGLILLNTIIEEIQ